MSPEMQAVSRSERRKARTTAAILDAAERHFLDRGFQAAKVDEIADDADVAVGSVYNHFASKEGLYGALLERALDLFETYMGEGAAGGPGARTAAGRGGSRGPLRPRAAGSHAAVGASAAAPPGRRSGRGGGERAPLARRPRAAHRSPDRGGGAQRRRAPARLPARSGIPMVGLEGGAHAWHPRRASRTRRRSRATRGARGRAANRRGRGGVGLRPHRAAGGARVARERSRSSSGPPAREALRRAPVLGNLRTELPELGLWTAQVEARSGTSPASVRRRLKALGRRLTSAEAGGARQEATPWAYRVLLRQLGVDPS